VIIWLKILLSAPFVPIGWVAKRIYVGSMMGWKWGSM
jgi:hypothetical protein